MTTDKRATKVTDAKLASLKLPAGKTEARVLVAVSYTHLTLPTNREV